MDKSSWHIYTGRPQADRPNEQDSAEAAGLEAAAEHLPEHHPLRRLPPAPPWRRLKPEHYSRYRGQVFEPDQTLIHVVNMALYLRRPLLVSGKPGSGKSSLAYAIAEEFQRPLFKWSITTRTTLQDGLYFYDAIRRLEDVQIYKEPKAGIDPVEQIGHYIKLGPLGTAMLPQHQPCILLIDEIDKGDIDLPNDLLNILEDGGYEIREIQRHQRILRSKHNDDRPAPTGRLLETIMVEDVDGNSVGVPGDGAIHCHAFPIIIMTSNGERDFPAAFLRRCLRYEIPPPTEEHLERIVSAHLSLAVAHAQRDQISSFVKLRKTFDDNLATDQLLNLIYLLARDIDLDENQRRQILQNLEGGV